MGGKITRNELAQILNNELNTIESISLESTGYGIVSGLTVMAQSTPNMSVNVASGIVHMANGDRLTPTGNSNLAINTASASNPRIDIVYVNSDSTIGYTAGIASTTPVVPSTPTGAFLLAQVNVNANATTITNSNITDERKIKNTSDNLGSSIVNMSKHTTGYVNSKEMGVETGDTNSSYVDRANAIQAVIDYAESQGIYKVTFPKSNYYIGHTIHIPCYMEIDFNDSSLIPIGDVANFTQGYMISINSTDGLTWDTPFVSRNVFISNVRLMNNSFYIDNLKGILIGTSTCLENIFSRNVWGTVKILDKYIDRVKLNNIVITYHEGTGYAIEQLVNIDNLNNTRGDAWEFNSLQIENTNRYLLHLNGTNTTCKISHVLNGYMMLENGDFNLEKIHNEEGIITIKNAHTTIKDSVLFHESLYPHQIVILTDSGKSKPVKLENVKFAYKTWRDDYGLPYGWFMPQILIQDNFSSYVSIDNCYQGIIREVNGNTGILIGTCDAAQGNKQSFNLFNYYSHTLSRRSTFTLNGIVGGFNIQSKIPNADFITASNVTLPIRFDRTGMLWKGATATYYYRVSIVSDFYRRVGYTQTGEISFSKILNESTIVEFSLNSSQLANEENFLVMIERGTTSGVYDRYCLVPITDKSSKLYDDYMTVNGVDWKQISGADLSLNYYSSIVKDLIIGKTIIYGTTAPTKGTWSPGDRVISPTPTVGQSKGIVCTVTGTPGTWVNEETVGSTTNIDNMARQALINDNFDIWQRGTTFTNPANGQFTADRWYVRKSVISGTFPNITHAQQEITPGELLNSKYFHRITTDGTGTSIGVSSYYILSQKIENGTRYLAGTGKTAKISFYARSSLANRKIGAYLNQSYGDTGGSTSEALNGTNFTLTTSWQKYSISIPLNDITGKTFSSTVPDYLNLNIVLLFNSGTNPTGDYIPDFGGVGDIDITQVQVCVNSEDLPYKPKHTEETFKNCLRYCEKSFIMATAPSQNAGTGKGEITVIQNTAGATTNYTPTIPFKVRKRATPTITLYNPSAANAQLRNTIANEDCSATTATNISENGFALTYTGSASSVSGQTCMIQYLSEAEF